jgi:hypothetical protein
LTASLKITAFLFLFYDEDYKETEKCRTKTSEIGNEKNQSDKIT